MGKGMKVLTGLALIVGGISGSYYLHKRSKAETIGRLVASGDYNTDKIRNYYDQQRSLADERKAR